MPSFSRNQIIEPDQVSIYHLISRCVRRAFLCGVDPYSGKSYEHRRAWITNRLAYVTEKVFWIETLSFAVMSNHFHLVVRIRPDLANAATDEEVIKRWWNLFPRKIKGMYLAEPPKILMNLWLSDPDWIAERRRRLSSISWLMSSISEYVARRANIEDGVTGRFWEGRFKSQILLGEKAVLSASTYVDLNPIRANMADSLESSAFTSIQKRIEEINKKIETGPSFLAKFYATLTSLRTETPSLAIDPRDYIDICAWKASLILAERNKTNTENLPNNKSLRYLEVYSDERVRRSKFAIGDPEDIREFAKKRNVFRPHICN